MDAVRGSAVCEHWLQWFHTDHIQPCIYLIIITEGGKDSMVDTWFKIKSYIHHDANFMKCIFTDINSVLPMCNCLYSILHRIQNNPPWPHNQFTLWKILKKLYISSQNSLHWWRCHTIYHVVLLKLTCYKSDSSDIYIFISFPHSRFNLGLFLKVFSVYLYHKTMNYQVLPSLTHRDSSWPAM